MIFQSDWTSSERPCETHAFPNSSFREVSEKEVICRSFPSPATIWSKFSLKRIKTSVISDSFIQLLSCSGEAKCHTLWVVASP